MRPQISNRTIFTGDNLEILRGFNSDSVDLVYLDPPFNSNRNRIASVGSEAAGAAFKDVWTLEDTDEKWLGEIAGQHPGLSSVISAVGLVGGHSDKAYLIYMAVRLLEVHRVMKDTASVYLHCDPTMSHPLKMVMDAIFGSSGPNRKRPGFRNEIIWCYSGGGIPRHDFPRKHDVILRYVKGTKYIFHVVRKPYAENTQQVGIHSTSSAPDNVIDLERGTPVTDWWTDIRTATGWSVERTGYPTQKPLALLERIIETSSNENDVVLDPFCGCATTCVAAEKLKRQWIGIDISRKTVVLAKRRLRNDLNRKAKKITVRRDVPRRTDAVETPPDISELRSAIDAFDREVQQLLNNRVRYALDIARLKGTRGDKEFYSPSREAKVLSDVLNRNRGPLSDAEAARLFREIMSATLAAERATRVAVLGPKGTYTQSAAFKHFGGSVHTVLLPTIRDIFREVESGNIGFGMVPVENSNEGSVADTVDLLMQTKLHICGEVELNIQHCLMSTATEISSVKTVRAHPQALAQCRQWLEHRLPGAAIRQTSSNAEAARRAARTKNTAAIANSLTADLYGLNILARGIEDNPHNHTRFVVIGDIATRATGNDKTSLLIAGRNKPGALYSLLAPIRDAGLDMTRIESRPTRSGLWEYVFFIDFTGHRDDKAVARALSALEKHAALCKVLGSYPRSVL